MNIIIVDDNEDARMILEKALESYGYTVKVATNGKEALTIAKASPPDMIISDILMPVMDGFSLCREWKGDEHLRGVPFVFYTATYTDSRDEELALSLGADRFIVKPVEPDEFMRIIQGVIRDMEKDKIKPKKPTLEEEEDVLKLYSERLVKKLEKKMLDLESESTERNRVEKELRESQKTLITVLDSMDAAVYVGDIKTHKILFMNRHMRKDFGSDLTGEICWKAFRNESGPCSHCTNDKLLDARGNPTGVHVWDDKNPITGRWYINHDRAIKWVDDRFVRLQLATDITRIKELEVEKLNAEAQLQQAQKMEAIGTLAGGIAHDFNNILGAIMGYSELMRMKLTEDSDLISDLDQVIKSGNRARDLVQQILTVGRQQRQEQRPIQIRYIIGEALNLLKATLPSTIEIREDLAKDAGIVNADPTQVHQVIMNLCTNAAHAMADDGVLMVSLANLELDEVGAAPYLDMAPGPHLRLTVGDTGSGMTTQVLEKVFDPYFTTKEPGEGTGLGLSVVQGIVKGHGGTITVYSEPGEGTTFHVYLPIIQETEERERGAEEPLPTGNERILCVDDEQVLAEIGKLMLERLGYRVTSRTGSLEGLELFRKDPDQFDLVITDMTMPEMTGDKLARELMKIRPDIPIILCTGHSKRISEEKAKGMGIRAFVMKPLVMLDLANTVRKALD